MSLSILDWAGVVGYLVITLALGLYFRRRSSGSTEDYFVSGRKVSWWLAGTSMVATTFAADTPLVVAGLVYTQGIAGNWLWWSLLPSGMMTVFFFARLWRRSGLVTDAEFSEMRYAGRAAAFLRGFRALYFGLLMSCLILGWVTKAMTTIIVATLGVSDATALLICLVFLMPFTGLYVSLGGLWAVLWTDLFQFVLKMAIVITIAWYAVSEIGGMSVLLSRLGAMRAAVPGAGDPTAFFPDFSRGLTAEALWLLPVLTFLMNLAVQWWAVWYPGAEPGGGSYIAQRMLAAKSERDALSGTLFFNVAHYALRPWPWIIVALSSMLVFPRLSDIAAAFPYVDQRLIGHDMAYSAMLRFLPAGFLGLMIAGLLAAYVSTLSTHLNWGTSYLVHDLYRRFLKPNAEERHYVLAGRVVTGLLMLAAAGVTFVLDSARQSFELLMSIGAGTGLLYLLRWFWWRINAWSEIAAMASSFVVSIGFFIAQKSGVAIGAPVVLLTTIAITSVCWIAATHLTAPTDSATLERFYRLVRPPGPGWRAVRERSRLEPSPDSLALSLLGWVLGCVFTYAALFGSGSFLYGRWGQGVMWLALFVTSGVGLVRLLPRLWSGGSGEQSASANMIAAPPTKAVVLARGLGTRMRAADEHARLTPEQAAMADSGVKGMIAIDRPFLDYVLSALADAGFGEVCLVIGPEHGTLRDYYESGGAPSRVRLSFAIQERPLGTADAVLAAADFIGDDAFVVLNADNYYPADALRELRAQHELAIAAFERETLVREGNIRPERITRYALLDVGADGYLRAIVEKPDEATARALGPNAAVSMNVWLLTPAILEACRRVPVSPRGELELPNAMQWAIDHLAVRVRALRVRAGVLDLSSRGDIPTVSARLRGTEVKL